MLSSRCELADDVFPVSDDLLGELYRANGLFVPGFVSTLPPDTKASLEHFSIRLGVSRVREISVAFFFGNTFEK
jgi:hypothetical protein